MSLPTDESIYNLIPENVQAERKPPRYRSKFADTVRDKPVAASKTMGPAKVSVNSPKDFLKSHSIGHKLPDRQPPRPGQAPSRPPGVPPHTERPQMGATSTRNFITTNAISNIMAVPRKPAAKCVDTAGGDRFDMENSGLVPKYVNKKEFGRVPVYLEQRKREVEEAQREYDCYVEGSMRRGQMEQVASDEREELLRGLKQNWAELHHQYQGLSLVTDTGPKRAHKERLEADMKQLERDIDLLDRHRRIYISQPHPQYW